MTNGKLSTYGKKLVAYSMLNKGKAFLYAALLLRKKNAYEYPVLHLLCQGIEIIGKGYLLLENYDEYKPKLPKKPYGHNLIELLNSIEKISKLNILKPQVKSELENLNGLYSKHLLRYGSIHDIFIDSGSIPSKLVLRRALAVLRLANKHGIFIEN